MYIQDQFNHNNHWCQTLIEVPDHVTAFYNLWTGGCSARFMFASNEQTLFWGTVADAYTGVWLLRNTNEKSYNKPMIAPITSSDIEQFKALKPDNYYQYWATYFAKKLISSEHSLLRKGHWAIKAGAIKNTSQCVHKSVDSLPDMDFVYNSDGIFTQPLHFIDWWVNGSSEIYALKDKPNETSGRVKWWRKKVKENSCPPVFAWFVNCLDAYVIIDGHSRLLAYQLEAKPINILILNAYENKKIMSPKQTSEMRLRVLHSLKCRLDNEEKNIRKTLNLDEINRIIMDLYSENSYERYITIGKPIANLDERWLAGVMQLCHNQKVAQERFDKFIHRERADQ